MFTINVIFWVDVVIFGFIKSKIQETFEMAPRPSFKNLMHNFVHNIVSEWKKNSPLQNKMQQQTEIKNGYVERRYYIVVIPDYERPPVILMYFVIIIY